MAKQRGHIKYTGTLGDVRHFKIKGQQGYFAGLVGGPTDTQVKTAPEFQRTRENMNEFGGCAKAGKSVRIALSEVLNGMTDPQCNWSFNFHYEKNKLRRWYRSSWRS
jgi:hypothetical protein